MLILTAASKTFSEMESITLSGKIAYAKRWGHTFINHRSQDGIDLAWERPVFWKRYLEKLSEGEWMWFLGCDTLIMNHLIDCREFTRDENYNLVIGQDANTLGNDSFFIRNCSESLNFLEDVSSFKNVGNLTDEQRAMNHLINLGRIKTAKVPHVLFNSYLDRLYSQKISVRDYEQGDFVLHFTTGTGVSYEKRVETAREFSKQVMV